MSATKEVDIKKVHDGDQELNSTVKREREAIAKFKPCRWALEAEEDFDVEDLPPLIWKDEVEEKKALA